MAHAFVSYVRENADQVDRLVLDLYRRGVDTWTDRDILPGQRWKPTIRQAIRDGVSFLACFSPEAVTRNRSYMHEEITLAIETLREMSTDRSWFLPVRLAECEIPDRDIGAGHTLRDLQWVDLFSGWEAGVMNIVSIIQQVLTYEQPLSPGSKEPRLPRLRNEPSSETLDAWRSVWSALFCLKIAGDALFNRVDQGTMREYATCLDKAIRCVGESAFFFDKDDFEQLNTLLQGALRFRAGKNSILDALEESHITARKADYIVYAIKQNLDAFDTFCRLLSETRDRYSVRTIRSTEHPSARRDKRSEQKVKALEAAAERSRREGNIRRAAELAVRSGKITLTTDCPRGHGKLREWDGMPRCWKCGWPWKEGDLV
jgi:hypothetical protein